ncbi:MAG: bifunctional riboflavin kinase/FAD synthetase [Acidobacteria bacterium]|nr:bifunctional riboflavin kinase/FAD synthetase [Acidobacteriota bacterium]
MEILRSLEDAAKRRGPSVVTIGNFDGIHLAHRDLLRRVRELTCDSDALSVAITFDPHPAEILRPDRAPKLLTPLPKKIELMQATGLDRLLILPFTKEFSQWSPERFVEEVLVKSLHATGVVIGENFRFGYRQAGNPQTLEELGKHHGFGTEIFPKMYVRNLLVSSSEIRSLLSKGKLVQANRLLGHCFSIRNAVESGLGIGRSQTVPTFNLAKYSGLMPASGVYITWATFEHGSERCNLRSVTNVGTRPTFGERELGIETHLLDPWQGPPPTDLEVTFPYRLRDERKFDSPEALKSQIMMDIRRAESYFRRLERWEVKV